MPIDINYLLSIVPSCGDLLILWLVNIKLFYIMHTQEFAGWGSISHANMWIIGSYKCYCSFPSSEPPCSTAETMQYLSVWEVCKPSSNWSINDTTYCIWGTVSAAVFTNGYFLWMWHRIVGAAVKVPGLVIPITCTYPIMNNSCYDFVFQACYLGICERACQIKKKKATTVTLAANYNWMSREQVG